MAERSSGSGRRFSRRDSCENVGSSSHHATPASSKERRNKKSSKPMKERWLLTRKTWRYMADAGRRLIPDGTHNRTEDIPKIEQYFQEVCQREPKFLLWRKASYPGSLGFRAHRNRRLVKGGSCRTKACSADEADDSRGSPNALVYQATSGGRFDPAKLKRDWLLASGSIPNTPIDQRRTREEDAEAKALADMLQKYLNMHGEPGESDNILAKDPKNSSSADSSGSTNFPFDYQSLIDKLQQHLNLIMSERKDDTSRRRIPPPPPPTLTTPPPPPPRASSSHNVPSNVNIYVPLEPTVPYRGDYIHKSLLETLSRHYAKSPNREHVISGILTDRKLLEKLYFDLRCTRGFRGPRATGAYNQPPRWWGNPRTRDNDWKSNQRGGRDLVSPPPLIAVQGPSTDRSPVDTAAQTDALSKEIIDSLIAEKDKEERDNPRDCGKNFRRRSSVENDDVSPSVSDTIKRYLRMARKKSMDADKADRFKRVNYDRNLRNIKAKGEITKPGDNDGNNKGSQTNENWILRYKESGALSIEGGDNISDADTTTSPASRNASSRSSIDAGLGSEEPTTPKHHHHQSFLSHLLHGSNTHKDKPHSAPGSPALTSSNSSGGAAMQKSKSSSSVVHHGSRLVAKRIWRSRSKSTSRTVNQPSVWTPQGKCTWAGTSGRRVTLQDTSLRALSEVERKVLCRVAVAKLQALNLGVVIRPPNESLTSRSVTNKPKRKAYLLKRKALTTGFFENKNKDDKDSSGGLVFGIPISQCLENDRLARIATGEISDVTCLSRSSRHGSRASFTSLIETPTTTTTTASKTEEGGSCESLSSKGGGALTGSDSGVIELSDSGGGGPPGEWDAVPGIVRQCIKHLEVTGLRTLGIFRVSPSKKRVRQLREEFDCGRETKIGPDQCPHDVATLLKEYFRDLPDPLLCRELYQAFVHTQKIRNRRLQQEALQHLVQLLPATNRETLCALLNFLTEVAANSEDSKSETGEWLTGNKMDLTNLATVFAPNILHCVKPGQARSEVSVERAEERIDVINVVRALLENASTLFTLPAALLDELYLQMMETHPADLDIALSQKAEEHCNDEIDPGSEIEVFSEENLISTAQTAKKVWSREQCLHQMAGIGGDIGPKPRRPKRPGSRRKEEGRSNSVDSGSSEDPTDPRRKSSPMVITANLTIPMSSAFTLNLDDPDIPYIEEQPKQPSAPPRRQRQRSISGCSEGGGRHGSDSAVGSSATLSGDQPPSSPPSWASSPPGSPDSAVTAVSYIPDQQAVLQRVSFTTSSEVRQISRSISQESSKHTSPAYTPSITSIGGAVLRSKTADIERMLHNSRPESTIVIQSKLATTTTTTSTTSTTSTTLSSNDNKKYTKRRYTDSRHQTRHIPDAESLSNRLPVTTTITQSSTISSNNNQGQRTTGITNAPVWKRRELISSAPKTRQNYF